MNGLMLTNQQQLLASVGIIYIFWEILCLCNHHCEIVTTNSALVVCTSCLVCAEDYNVKKISSNCPYVCGLPRFLNWLKFDNYGAQEVTQMCLLFLKSTHIFISPARFINCTNILEIARPFFSYFAHPFY